MILLVSMLIGQALHRCNNIIIWFPVWTAGDVSQTALFTSTNNINSLFWMEKGSLELRLSSSIQTSFRIPSVIACVAIRPNIMFDSKKQWINIKKCIYLTNLKTFVTTSQHSVKQIMSRGKIIDYCDVSSHISISCVCLAISPYLADLYTSIFLKVRLN